MSHLARCLWVDERISPFKRAKPGNELVWMGLRDLRNPYKEVGSSGLINYYFEIICHMSVQTTQTRPHTSSAKRQKRDDNQRFIHVVIYIRDTSNSAPSNAAQ